MSEKETDPATQLPAELPCQRVPELTLLGALVPWADREESQAPVHGTANTAKVLADARALTARVLDLVANGLHLRSAFVVLQTYSKSCINHLLRSNFEEGPWVQELENILLHALGKLAASPGSADAAFGPIQQDIASMRTKDGGLGFGGLPRTTSCAYLGSWFLCLEHVAKHLGAHSWATFSAKCPSVIAQMDRASSQAVGIGALSRPVDWLHPLEKHMPKIQSRFAEQAAKD